MTINQSIDKSINQTFIESMNRLIDDGLLDGHGHGVVRDERVHGRIVTTLHTVYAFMLIRLNLINARENQFAYVHKTVRCEEPDCEKEPWKLKINPEIN